MKGISVACFLLILSVLLRAQAFHTNTSCEAKHRDLLQETASFGRECGDTKFYDCCAGTVLSKVYHDYYHTPDMYQVQSSCDASLDPFQTSSRSRLARCDMKSDNGGWMVVLRRDSSVSPRVDFDRTWEDYENGFGELETEFWYGLKEMHCLTQKEVEMRIDLTATNGTKFYWTYGLFTIDGPETNYTLHIGEAVGSPGTHAPDPLTKNINNGGIGPQKFTTKDRDNDRFGSLNCAQHHDSGWWWTNCGFIEFRGNSDSMQWHENQWIYISSVEMKIRPKSCDILV